MQELLIDVDNENKKILLVENGKLIEKYEENPWRDRLEGNIFLGIVENILPGMQAAFVNIVKEKNTFIHIKDIIPKMSNETGNKLEKLKNEESFFFYFWILRKNKGIYKTVNIEH